MDISEIKGLQRIGVCFVLELAQIVQDLPPSAGEDQLGTCLLELEFLPRGTTTTLLIYGLNQRQVRGLNVVKIPNYSGGLSDQVSTWLRMCERHS